MTVPVFPDIDGAQHWYVVTKDGLVGLRGLYATLCGRPYLQVAALGANGLAGRCLSLDMRR